MLPPAIQSPAPAKAWKQMPGPFSLAFSGVEGWTEEDRKLLAGALRAAMPSHFPLAPSGATVDPRNHRVMLRVNATRSYSPKAGSADAWLQEALEGDNAYIGLDHVLEDGKDPRRSEDRVSRIIDRKLDAQTLRAAQARLGYLPELFWGRCSLQDSEEDGFGKAVFGKLLTKESFTRWRATAMKDFTAQDVIELMEPLPVEARSPARIRAEAIQALGRFLGRWIARTYPPEAKVCVENRPVPPQKASLTP